MLAATKRSPIVLIRMLVALEALALLAYTLTAAIGNYEYDWFPNFFLQNFMSFQTAKFLFLSGAQFIITLYVFLRWYRESYAAEDGAVLHRTGVFFRREETFAIDASAQMTVSASPLGKRLHYGNIRIKNKEGILAAVLKDIPSPDHFLQTMRQAQNGETELMELLKKEENDELEFKSSLRFDYGIRRPSRNLERSAMKTIAAFLNSRGGSFVVGVNDQRTPIGLKKDYETLQRKDRDGFENHFTQIFNAMIGPEFRTHVNLKFAKIRNAEICHIKVKPSPKPVYFKYEEHEHFYMRTGNITASLKLSEMESYIRSRWPNGRK